MNESERIRRLKFYKSFNPPKTPRRRDFKEFRMVQTSNGEQDEKNPVLPIFSIGRKLVSQIDELGLSARARNTLRRNSPYLIGVNNYGEPYQDSYTNELINKGILPIEDLSELSRVPDGYLLEFRMLGPKALSEIRNRIPYTGT